MTCAYPAGSVRRLAADGGLLLFDDASQRLFAYNQTAGFLWDLVEQRASDGELAAALAARFGIPRDIACADVEAILDQWRQQALVEPGNGHVSVPDDKHGSDTDWATVPEPRWAATSIITFNRTTFALAAEHADWGRTLSFFFRHLETPSARPQVCLELREASAGRTALLLNGIERVRSDDREQLLGCVNRVILECLHPGVEWLAMIHGAALARNGAGLALPAPCGSGKTTLSAYLVAKGYEYLADDQVSLAAPDGHIVPWPMPLSIKRGSFKVLSATYPDLPSWPGHRTHRGDIRQLIPPERVWSTAPLPLSAFVFPRYRAGAAAELRRLTSFETIELLLSDKMWLGYPLTESRVRAFVTWLADKPAYSLVYGDLAEAACRVQEIA